MIYCRITLHAHFDTVSNNRTIAVFALLFMIYIHTDTTLHEILLTQTATEQLHANGSMENGRYYTAKTGRLIYQGVNTHCDHTQLIKARKDTTKVIGNLHGKGN